MHDGSLPEDFTKLKHHYCVLSPAFIDVVVGLHCFFNDVEKVNAWLLTPNPMFGEVAPLRLVQMGRTNKLLAFINNALEEGELDGGST